MSRTEVLTGELWTRIEPLLPPQKGPMGKPLRPRRRLVERSIYRLRTGITLAGPAARFGRGGPCEPGGEIPPGSPTGHVDAELLPLAGRPGFTRHVSFSQQGDRVRRRPVAAGYDERHRSKHEFVVRRSAQTRASRSRSQSSPSRCRAFRARRDACCRSGQSRGPSPRAAGPSLGCRWRSRRRPRPTASPPSRLAVLSGGVWRPAPPGSASGCDTGPPAEARNLSESSALAGSRVDGPSRRLGLAFKTFGRPDPSGRW